MSPPPGREPGVAPVAPRVGPLPAPSATTTAVAPARVPWSWRLREALASYLPMLLMAALALGTWWLVKNTPEAPTARADRPLRHEADYTMRDFTVQRFTREGRLRIEVEGREARHYPDTDTIEIDGVQIRAIAPDGGVTVATARRALANGEATEVQLLGGAQVVQEPQRPGDEPIEFRGEFLHAFLDTEQLRSHLPVTIWRGNAELQAGALEYDHKTRLLNLSGKVRATLPPPGATTRGLGR